MKYNDDQINAVRELAKLYDLGLTLSESQCSEYLDWHLTTQSAAARGIKSISQARQTMSEPMNRLDQQRLMLQFVASPGS